MSFEYIDLTISSSSTNQIRLITLYRPPGRKKNAQTPPVFFQEFSALVELIQSINVKVLLAGDFNFHVDNQSNQHASTFLDMLRDMGLRNHVNCTTHNSGHTLDLIISRPEDNLISDVSSIYEFFAIGSPCGYLPYSDFTANSSPEDYNVQSSEDCKH